ncbi:MAG: MMPL family transporter [Clostridiales Family XIII bacterium]|nr:MMPL family transporter [Clostridiales Family XIII bacterium]
MKHKKLVTAVFFASAAVCAILSTRVAVNYNVADYLPEHAPSTQAIRVMDEEFTSSVPNTRVMVPGVTIPGALAVKAELEAVPHVSGVTWLDDAVNVAVPLEAEDPDLVESYYKDGNALFSLTVQKGEEIPAFERIFEIIGDEGAVTGQSATAYTAQTASSGEVMNASLILVPLILVILLLATGAWAEPILFLLAIGVAIVLNMGTNAFSGEVSFITNSVSPILQLAVSLDYAIFLLHSFQTYREETDDVAEAMRRAVKRSFPVIFASALTTMFGFGALCFMEFRVGSDMGLSLMKGVALSLLCASVLLPAVTLCFYKLIDKTKHRRLMPAFSGVGKPLLKIGGPVAVLVCLACAPAFLAQSHTDFIYGMGAMADGTRLAADSAKIEEAFGKSVPVAILVPRGEPAKELALSDALLDLPGTDSVISYAKTVGTGIPADFAGGKVEEQFYSEKYARIVAYADTPDEGAVAFAYVQSLRDTVQGFYGDAYYATGESLTLYDMKNVVTGDNRLVTLLSILAIGIVLIFTFRSIALPIILLLAIESAIWINMSLAYFMGSTLSYIGYLIISAVQLGATVDYAILATDHYMSSRRLMPRKEAARAALGGAFRSVLISAGILSLAGFTLWGTSSNSIVQALGFLVGRGGLLSLASVALFLPTLLIWLDPFVRATTRNAGFYKGETT